jgi:hypothetical protein
VAEPGDHGQRHLAVHVGSITAPVITLASSPAALTRRSTPVDLVEREIAAAGDGDQHALGARDRQVIEQRAGRHLRRLDRAVGTKPSVPISALPRLTSPP